MTIILTNLQLFPQKILTIFNPNSSAKIASDPLMASINNSTSGTYFKSNFSRYWAGIIGGPVTIAGKDLGIIPTVLGLTSVISLFLNLFSNKHKLLGLYFFMSISGTLLFISTFRIVDARYLFALVPALILSFGFLLDTLHPYLIKINREIYYKFLIFLTFIILIYNVTPQILDQLNVNFFHPEPSTNFEAINTINNYTNTLNSDQKPLVISVLSPFMVDFYSNHKYELLPLSKSQNFMDVPSLVWKINDKTDLQEIYKGYLRENKKLLLSSYKTDIKYFYYYDLQNLLENFNLKMVYKGCNNMCNLYKISLKEEAKVGY